MTSKFRGDIQGLRAIAVLLVVLYHSGVSILSGGYVGVDVFFVISGFLITSHIWGEVQRNGRLDFASFYARRARRILPASFAVLAASIVAMFIWMPPLQWTQTLTAAAATALYIPNVFFWREGTDYLAETSPSLFQHYWSLGIEEQFYLIWPALLVLAFIVTRRSFRGLVITVALVVAGSFALSVVLTPVSQPFAFFMLPTRAWELGVGGLLALLVAVSPRWLASRAVGLLGWAGLALIGYAAFVFTELTIFPGAAALVPVLGTAMVILSGAGSAPRWSPGGALSVRPAQFVGKISYSLYLVHWPLVVIPQEAVGLNTPLPLWGTLLLGAIGFPLAWLCWRYVEEPGRKARIFAAARPRRSLLAAGVASVAIVAICVSSVLTTRDMPLYAPMAAAAGPIGASPEGTAFVPSNLTPSLRASSDDNPAIYASGCHQSYEGVDPSGCVEGSDMSAPLVALFGDSHAAQWYPALSVLAAEGIIRLQVNTKSACASAMIPETTYPGCERWRSAVIETYGDTRPDIVLLGNYAVQQVADTGAADPADFWRDALDATISKLPSASTVLVVADTPASRAPATICLSRHLEDAGACSLARDASVNEEFRAAEASVADGYIDLVPSMCDDEVCPAIIGDVLVYRDAHHITETFSEHLAPAMGRSLEKWLESQR